MILTEADVKKALQQAGVDAEIDTIEPTDSFKKLGLDSLDLFNLFVELETITGIQIPDEDIEHLTSIKAVLEYHEKL